MSMGKPELKLAYQTGALSIINKLEAAGIIVKETQEKLTWDTDEEFEKWFQGISALFRRVGV